MLLIFQLAMSGDFLPVNIALMFALLNTTLGVTVFYLNSLWIFPKIFERKKYWLYIFVNLIVIVALSHLFFVIDRHIVLRFKPTDMPKHLPMFSPYVRIFSLLLFIFIVSLVFSLIRKIQTQDLTEKQLSKEKINTEIQLLKAQINPHFIFNSMNNIYSLAYSKSEETPTAVLKLSDMMRYVYYDCNKDEVALGAELEYLSNYIAFQQMKSPNEQNIVFDHSGADETIRLAPMLFIPFVENSFKYSKIEDSKDAWVKISISTDNDMLTFRIANSYPQNDDSHGSGMGIKNVKSRLELTYPNKHEFRVENKDSLFKVEMKITKS